MKAILSFNLPEEQEEFKDASEGNNWRAAVCEILQELAELEAGDTKPDAGDIRIKVWAILNDRKLDPYDP